MQNQFLSTSGWRRWGRGSTFTCICMQVKLHFLHTRLKSRKFLAVGLKHKMCDLHVEGVTGDCHQETWLCFIQEEVSCSSTTHTPSVYILMFRTNCDSLTENKLHISSLNLSVKSVRPFVWQFCSIKTCCMFLLVRELTIMSPGGGGKTLTRNNLNSLNRHTAAAQHPHSKVWHCQLQQLVYTFRGLNKEFRSCRCRNTFFSLSCFS